MRKLNHFIQLLAVFAVALVGHPDTARAALGFSPSNFVNLTIGGPGQSATSTPVTVTSTAGTVTSLSLTNFSTSGGNWMCPASNGNIITVATGPGSGCDTSQLAANTNYNGSFMVTSPSTGDMATVNVFLQVGGAGSNGLLSTLPASLTFTESFAGQISSPQSVTVYYSNAPVTVTGVIFTPGQGGVSFVNSTFNGSSVTVQPNNAASFSGTYTGTAQISTVNGNVNLPITLQVGSGSVAGLSASPNPVSLSASTVGGTTSTQAVSILNNGGQITPTSIASISQSWLNAFVSGNVVYVSANTGGLAFGNNYSGTVSVNTPFGLANFQVNLAIGTSSTNGLTASPSPVTLFTATQNGSVTPQFVTINYNGTPVAASSVTYTTSTGQSWLQAFLSGSQVEVTANTSVVGIGSYSGTVTAQTVYGPISIPVNLGVGANGGNTSGLAALPSSLNFNIAVVGSGTTSQNVAITYNGLAVTIQSVSTNTNSTQSFLVVTPTQSGLIVGINGASLTAGAYTATITVNTPSGSLNIPVTLNVGSGGGSSSGLSASANPVTLSTLTVGGAVASQTVAINYNGAAAAVQSVSVSTSTGQGWLIASTAGGNLISVGANTSGLGTGTYTGTVYANTSFGTATFLVNLTIGSTGANGLTASPNPVSLTASAPGATVTPQTVSVLYNGSTASITSVSATTVSGGNWLAASSLGTSVSVGANTSGLAAGVYTGTVTVNTTFGTTQFQVNLTVGGSGSANSPLTASPNPVVFQEATAGQGGTQTVSASYLGALTPIQNATFTAADLFTTFVNIQMNSNGTVTLNLNNIAQNVGTYSGTLLLYTANGQINVPVTLQIGTGGGGTIGLGATPNPVSFNVQTGGAASPQTVSITNSGAQVTVTNVSSTTTTGQNWLLPTAGASSVVVNVNAANLSAGTYTGTVNVTTTAGSLSFQVNLTVGGSPTISANTQAINLAYQVGTTAPAAQTLLISSNGSPVNLSVTSTVNSGGSWLVLTPSGQISTGTPITVSIQPQGLAAGATYTGNISVQTFGGATNGSLNIPVNLLVSNSPVISASPASLSFTAQQGTSPGAQTVNLASSSSQLGYTATATVTSGGSWLQIPTQSSVTPSGLTVTVNSATLSAGTYQGTITVQAPGAGNPSLTIPVTLTITSGSLLQIGPSSLAFAYQLGQQIPANQVVTIGTPNGAATSFTATIASGSFFTTTPTSGNAPASMTVSVNTSGLAAGTYNGSISVTSPGSSAPQTIPVSLVVSNTTLFNLSASGVTLTAPAASLTPVTQSVTVQSTDSNSLTFTTVAASSGNWLSASSPVTTTPSTLTITANPAGLAQGTYTGTVTLAVTNLPNVANSPFVIQVTLVIGSGSSGGGTTLASSPASLTFAQQIGGVTSPAQAITISGPATGSTYTAVASLPFGQNWLSVSPASFAIPASLTVSVNGLGLAAGTYNASIIVSAVSGGSSLTIPVTFTVGTTPILPSIVVTPASLTAVNIQNTASPSVQNLSISLSNGTAASFTATATTTSGGPWLAVTPGTGTTPGNLSVTFSPAGLPAGVYNGNVAITVAGSPNSPINLPVTMTVTASAVTAPAVVAVQNAASNIPTSLSPGLNIVIRGSNMGPATLIAAQASGSSFATSLSGTQVTFDGVPAPMIYTSNNQVSVMVPYEVAGKASTSMVVSYNGVSSTPLSLRVVNTAPGIYTLTMTGAGQGAVFNQNGTVNGPQNPEVVGDVLQIYLTGEGQITPAGVNGALTRGTPPFPTPVNTPVTVQIGGVNAVVAYAGEAPTLISGVMQVNAIVPAGAGTGAVPLVVNVGGVASQANVTVSLR